MNVREWRSARKAVHDDFYTDLVTTSGCGAFDGGCVVVAEALLQAMGGKIVVLVREDDQADHAAVLRDGKLWDYDGPLPPGQFIARFNRTELAHTPWRCSGYRAIAAGDLEDAYRDDALAERLADLFRRMLPEIAERESHTPRMGAR